jgi:hypothetical protein
MRFISFIFLCLNLDFKVIPSRDGKGLGKKKAFNNSFASGGLEEVFLSIPLYHCTRRMGLELLIIGCGFLLPATPGVPQTACTLCRCIDKAQHSDLR